jgi:DCN1-like protein 1/2
MDSIDSLEGMKNALPGLRRQLNTDPVYFKKVYMHTFDLAKAPGARTLTFDTGKSSSGLWRFYKLTTST